jgi:3-oxoacyl-[acyl-carrier protein] reductase
MAYTVSKAAIGGVVRSLSVDLGRSHRILVNGVLPGVVDTPMARKGLTSEQIAKVVEATPIGTLVTPKDVGNAVYLLGSELNTGISGQSLLVDNAFSVTFLP